MNERTTLAHRVFKPLKQILPGPISSFVRSFITAFSTPIYFSFLNGHFKSSFKKKSVSRKGEPIPWYTYPMIDLLNTRPFSGKTILEFGGGQSTLWWAKRADKIVTFDGNKEWHDMLKKIIPSNVDLFLVSEESPKKCIEEVEAALNKTGITKFDIVIIDGLYRDHLIDIACKYVSANGGIICDNAESYGFYEGFKNRSFLRTDFFGHAPGVYLPHSTSLYFTEKCFLFDPQHKIPIIN